VLGVKEDLVRWNEARAVLTRPEVRFVPAELKGPALVLAPLSRLPAGLKAKYDEAATAAPDRFSAVDLPDCGFLPEVTCTKQVLKRVVAFLEKVK
jgi:hypothetical protein